MFRHLEQPRVLRCDTLARCQQNPTGSSKSVAAKFGIHEHLQPHRSQTFKLSNDRLFVDKVRDIIGLYLSPPNRALVLSIDEKSQIQALAGC